MTEFFPDEVRSNFWAVAFGEYAMALGAPERRMVSVFRYSWIYVLGAAVTTIVLLLYIDLS
jgi:urease accessory protein UreF